MSKLFKDIIQLCSLSAFLSSNPCLQLRAEVLCPMHTVIGSQTQMVVLARLIPNRTQG